MFHPQEMTEVEIVVPEYQILPVINLLAQYGVFHQSDTSYLSSDAGLDSAREWRSKAAAYSSLEHRLLSAMQVLEIEEGEPVTKEFTNLADADMVFPTTDQLETEVQAIMGELNSQQKELERYQQYIDQLEPITDVGIDLDAVEELQYLFGMIGLMPADNVERLKTSLLRVPFVLLTLEHNQEQAVVVLCGPRKNADILERAARSAYLNPLNLPEECHGTPQDILKTMHKKVDELQGQISEQKANLKELRQSSKEQFQNLLWRVRVSRLMAEAMSRFGKLQYTYLVVGWVPTLQFEKVSQALRKISDEIVIESHVASRDDKDQHIPVYLQNRGIIGAFQQLVTTYGRPRYEEVDPTILLALTFPILFGAMFGDVGHGLMLALLGFLLASGKIKALQSMASLGKVIIVCGLMAIGFGFLYGSVFGLETLLPAIWLRPMENILTILIITVIGGVVILNLAYVINFINALKTNNWSRLLLGSTGVSGLLLYWGLLGVAVSLLQNNILLPTLPFAILAGIGCLLVMLSDLLKNLMENHRPLIVGGLGTYVIQVFFELFETVISLFSNSLSYVRVGAFAVAHAGLSAVIFILAELVSASHGPGYWITLVLGNLFIIGFEGLIVGIQTLRLEYYEFLSKFFSGGGKGFNPLRIDEA